MSEDDAAEETTIRVFSRGSGPVLTDVPRSYSLNSAQTKVSSSDSEADQTEISRQAREVAVDFRSIIAQAPMLQVEFQKIQRRSRGEEKNLTQVGHSRGISSVPQERSVHSQTTSTAGNRKHLRSKHKFAIEQEIRKSVIRKYKKRTRTKNDQ